MKRSLSPAGRRRPGAFARLGGAGAAVCLLAAVAGAQQAPAPEQGAPTDPRGIAASDLRLGSDDLPRTLRRTPRESAGSFSPGRDQTPYEPFGRGSEDARDRRDDFDAPAPDEALDPQEAVEPDFDLFEGPDDARARPGNLATAPAPAAGAFPDPSASAPLPGARSAATPLPEGTEDPLLAAQRRGVPELGLAVPAAALATRRTDTIAGRINLPVTGLRPTIPIAADDAFAPVGVRAGSFILYSALEQGLGVSSNLGGSPGGASGAFSETQLSGRLLSDWSRHQLDVNALASYRRNFSGEIESEPLLSLDGRLRLDVDRLTTATLRGAVQYRQADPLDLSAAQTLSDRPDVMTYSAGAGVERTFGRAKLGLDATAVRETTSNEAPAGVAILDEAYTTTTAGLRAGYELSPAVTPFVAGSLGRRTFDESVDLAGIERDSVIRSLRSGVTFDLGEKLLGEVAAGYAWNVPDADGLATTGSPTLDARIAWSPQRGTDVVLSATTSFEPDTAGAATATLYEGALSLRHRATARTDLTAALSAAYRDSDVETDRETSYAAEAGVTRWISRTLAFTGLLRHERLDSETPGGDYDANSIRIGLRLQR